ncbi:MAG: phosphotransferase [Chloroflexi bacterium]|nr:phosphotransferase [Chloroflexota bacterium]
MDKPTHFSQLNLQQQRTLFEGAAAELLPQWQIGEHSLSWIGYDTNAVFAVTTAAERYFLRLHPPGRVDEDDVHSELIWLLAIRQQTGLLAPLPVPVSNGGLLTSYIPPMLPSAGQIHAVLFERLRGETKSASAFTVVDARAVGGYLGRLHRDSQFEPPADFKRHRLDFGGIFEAESAYYVTNESEVLTREQIRVFQAVSDRARQAMPCRDQPGAGIGLIHADLLAKNLLFVENSVAALDFEYCAWGYFLYDLAPLLWEFRGERAADYVELEDALWAGYLSIRPQAAAQRDDLEAFIAARQMLSCRWLLQNLHNPKVREVAPTLLQERIRELEGYLSTGKLQRRTATL